MDARTHPMGADEPPPNGCGTDPVRLANQLAEMRANVILQGMGGIAAYYPTDDRVSLPQSRTAARPRHVWRCVA